MPKVAVLLYVYYPHKWDIIKQLLLQIKDNIDIFLATCEDIDCVKVIEECKELFNTQKVLIVKNKGLDLGPFLKQLETLDCTKYPIFLKLHTKVSSVNSTLDWSTCLFNSTIGSSYIFKQNIKALENIKTGVLCDQNFITSNNERAHRSTIEHLCSIVNIDYSKTRLSAFMTGSIFFGKTDTFKSVFTKQKTKHILTLLEEGVESQQKVSSYTHALECVMGYAVTHNNSNIKPCITPSVKLFNLQINKTLNLITTYNDTCYIKENPLMHGKVTNKKKDSIRIVWSHCDNKEHIYINQGEFFIRKDETAVENTFNVLEYKCLYADLIQLSDHDATQHYINHGKHEGRVELKSKIANVFNKHYYTKEYGVSEHTALENYIEKGRFEGRLFAPEILQTNFDYGFYISYRNINDNNTCYNMYDAFANKDKTDINNIVTFKSSNKLQSVCCIYVAEIHTHRDMYFALSDLEELTKHCKHVVIVSNKQIKGYQCIILKKQPENFLWHIQTIDTALKHINKNYKNYIVTTNRTVVLQGLKNILLKFQNSNRDFTSLTDCYSAHIYKGIPQYHLQCDILHFNHNCLQTYKDFIQNFLIKSYNTFLINELYEFELTEFLLKNNKTVGAILTPTHELEFFWKDLFTLKLNLQPSVLHKHNIPIVHKRNLNYFTQLIPQHFKKEHKAFKLKCFFKHTQSTYKLFKKIGIVIHVHYENRVEEFKQYINQINDKCDATFYITGNKDIYKQLKSKNIKMHFIESDNRGMDIGPFIKVMDILISQNKTYDFIVKLQDKATTAWRKYCFSNLIDNLIQYQNILQSDSVDVGGSYSLLTQLDDTNKSSITEFAQRYNIPFNYEREQQSNAFIAGTMFIIKHKCFNNFIKKYEIDLKYEYEMLEKGKVTNMYATNTHAWERIFTCVIPTVMQTKVKCI